MIYIKLFINFILVGTFSFGAYSVIPLINSIADNFGDISSEMFADIIAIAESTPGALAVNLATFVGTKEAGLTGALVATIAVIIPAFIIILLFTIYISKYFENKYVKFAMSIIRPCVMGMIIASGCFILFNSIFVNANNVFTFENNLIIKAIIIAIILILIMIYYNKILNKKLSVILTIIFGAILGIVINFIL